MAKANIGKRSEIREYFEIDPESRVKETHIYVCAVQNKPVSSFGRLPELKEYHHSVIRQVLSPHQFVQDPHEKVGIEMFVVEIATRPFVSPDSQGLNDGRELPAGLGEMVLGASRVRDRPALDNPDVGQGVEALA